MTEPRLAVGSNSAFLLLQTPLRHHAGGHAWPPMGLVWLPLSALRREQLIKKWGWEHLGCPLQAPVQLEVDFRRPGSIVNVLELLKVTAVCFGHWCWLPPFPLQGTGLSCSQPALDITTLTPLCSPSHPPSPEPITPCPPPPPPSSGCPLALCFPRAGWLAPQCRGAGLTSPGGGRQQCQGEKWTPEPPRAWLCSTRPVTLFSRDWPLRMH